MAWSESKIFVATLEDILENTTAIDLNDTSAGTFLVALYDNDITPSQTVTSANTAYNVDQWTASGNEVSDGTNWDAGGEPLTSVTFTTATNKLTWDAADTPQGGASTTLANVYGCLVYAALIASPVADQGISYHYFSGVQSVTAGSFTVVWDATNGIFSLTI
jgi:hypothetical protein